MPASYAHKQFGINVLKKLDKKPKKSLNNVVDFYNAFSHSFDNLFFYNFFNPFKGKNIRYLGHYGQNHNVNLYFENMIKYLKENYSEAGFAYLSGSINHYILDSTFHPYIIYKTGRYYKNKPNTYKYNGLHGVFEFNLDAYVYKLTNNKSIRHIKSKEEIHSQLKFDKDLLQMIDYVFENTFKAQNMGKIYEKSNQHYRLCYYLGFEDKLGIKTKIYSLFDKISSNKVNNISSHTTYYKNIKTELFNLENKPWNHPCDKKIIYTHSINDLYNIATDKSVKLINELHNVIINKLDEKSILKKIGNNSYSSGMPLEQNKKLKYFEF